MSPSPRSFIVFFALIVLGVPVGFALLNAALVFLCFSQPTPMVALPQNMVDGTTNFVLLAIPFFIFAGAIMEQGGLSRRFVRLVQAVVGHIRGGLLQVIVVSMYPCQACRAQGSGCRRGRFGHALDVAAPRLRHGGGHCRARRIRRHGRDHPAQHRHVGSGLDHHFVDGIAFAAGLIPAAVLAVCLMVVVYFVRAGPRAFRHNAPACRKCDAQPSQRYFRC